MTNVARYQSRTLAFQVLYSLQYSLKKEQYLDISDDLQNQTFPTLESLFSHLGYPLPLEGDSFTLTLVQGTLKRYREILEIIEKNLRHRSINKIGQIELTLLIMATFELKFLETPVGIAINEALRLAHKFSDKTAAGFINGILDNVAKEQNSLSSHS